MPFVCAPSDRSRIDKSALQSHRRAGTAASTAPRPNVRDDGQRPSPSDETARLIVLICPTDEAEYFFGEVWTGQITLKGFDKSPFWRKGVDASLMDDWVLHEAEDG